MSYEVKAKIFNGKKYIDCTTLRQIVNLKIKSIDEIWGSEEIGFGADHALRWVDGILEFVENSEDKPVNMALLPDWFEGGLQQVMVIADTDEVLEIYPNE